MAAYGGHVTVRQSNPRFSITFHNFFYAVIFCYTSTIIFKKVFVSDEDKEMAKLLTGYQDMVGLLNVHKVARINTQVPPSHTSSWSLYTNR